MRSACLALLSAVLLLLGFSGRLTAAEPEDLADEERLLREAKLPTDGPGLLDFFRQRTLLEAKAKRIPDLVKLLANDDFATRKKASDELQTLGPPALPLLRRALADAKDAEARTRLRDCIDTLEGIPSAEQAVAAVHLVRARKPAGSTAVLVAYLPFADDDAVENEVLLTLAVTGVNSGKVDDALAAALGDKETARRAAAALVLGRYGSAEQKATVRKLLADPEPRIRMRAAQGLLAAREKNVVPVLLALLDKAPLGTARQAEDVLGRMAGDTAPGTLLSEDAKVRQKCVEAWQAWWTANEGKLDLAKADVDLTSINADALAKAACRQLFQGIVKGDSSLILKSIDVPFNLAGIQTFNTKEEFVKMMEGRPAEATKAEVKVVRSTNLEEYRKKATPEMQEFIKYAEKTRGRLIYMQIAENNRAEGVVFLVRVTGGKGRVIGAGQASADEK